jgi:polyhydroxyalkanoate synthesis regulator protein
MREAMQKTVGAFLPPGMEDVGRKNMEMMERAMTLFTPFYRDESAKPSADLNEYQEEILSLRAEVERLQQQLAVARAKPRRAE